MKTVICDIDGVIADCTHRLKFIQQSPPDWDAFFDACGEDTPILPMITFLRGVAKAFSVVYATGRPERTRVKTVEWCAKHDIPAGLVLMRTDNDHREDFIVKRELVLKGLTNKSREIVAVFEDRDQVVKMWREHGLLCLQPKAGDY